MYKIAFHTRYGHYEYVVTPFRLTNTPVTFMDLMSRALKPYLDKFMVLFIGDILVYSRTLEEHPYHLREVLEVLSKHELYAKLKKCEFCLEKEAFLGHVVSREGISVNAQKIEAITQWPRAKNATEVRGLLHPSLNLTKKIAKFKWTDKCEGAFQELKKRLISAPVLALPGNEEHFVVIVMHRGVD